MRTCLFAQSALSMISRSFCNGESSLEYLKGHLIGNQFNGSGNIDNLVPQSSAINGSGGEWYKMEQEWAVALKDGKSVNVDISVSYPPNSVRPDGFIVNYNIDGEDISRIIFND